MATLFTGDVDFVEALADVGLNGPVRSEWQVYLPGTLTSLRFQDFNPTACKKRDASRLNAATRRNRISPTITIVFLLVARLSS